MGWGFLFLLGLQFSSASPGPCDLEKHHPHGTGQPLSSLSVLLHPGLEISLDHSLPRLVVTPSH